MKLANNRRRETQLVAVDFVVANKMIGRRVAVRLEGNRVFVDGVGYSPTELRRQIAHLRRTAKTLASRNA